MRACFLCFLCQNTVPVGLLWGAAGKLRRHTKQLRRLVAELAKIQHPLAQEVLRRRYMNGESYAEICDALALVERRVYQLHRLGVNKVCEPENGG